MRQGRKSVKRESVDIPTHDTGLAEAFIKVTKRRAIYVIESERTGYWLVWDKDHWTKDHGSRIRNAIDGFLGSLPERYHKFRTDTFIRRIERRMQDLTATQEKELNNDPKLIALRNYVVHVDTGEYMAPSPSFGITRNLDVDYDEYIPGDWSKFVLELFGNRHVAVAAQKLIGYSLFTSGNPENLFIVIKGPTGTGKGTFIETIANVFGHMTKAVRLSIFREKQSESARSDVVAAMTTRLAYSNEASSAWELHADAIKRFTGYERMSSREVYGKEFDAKPECTPIVVTNHAPLVKGQDAAMQRRLLCLPVPASEKPRKNEVGLSDRLARECATEVFMWALRGYWKYLDSGMDDVRKICARASTKLFQEMSPVAEFIARKTVAEEGAIVLQSDIHALYCTWAQEHMDARTLGVELSALGWENGPRKHGGLRTRIGRKLR